MPFFHQPTRHEYYAVVVKKELAEAISPTNSIRLPYQLISYIADNLDHPHTTSRSITACDGRIVNLANQLLRIKLRSVINKPNIKDPNTNNRCLQRFYLLARLVVIILLLSVVWVCRSDLATLLPL